MTGGWLALALLPLAVFASAARADTSGQSLALKTFDAALRDPFILPTATRADTATWLRCQWVVRSQGPMTESTPVASHNETYVFKEPRGFYRYDPAEREISPVKTPVVTENVVGYRIDIASTGGGSVLKTWSLLAIDRRTLSLSWTGAIWTEDASGTELTQGIRQSGEGGCTIIPPQPIAPEEPRKF